jgi:hypothetical protein
MVAINEILKGVDKPSLELVAETLAKETPALPIDKPNWPTSSYKPKALVNMGYNDAELFLKFTVEEESVRAIYTENNSKVSKDSCCELFISPDSNDCYYNFELSCIGTMLMGYRKMGEAATRPSTEIMEQVRRQSSLGKHPFDVKEGLFCWTLTVAIPLGAFFAHKLTCLKKCNFTANIYKCGDELPKPHYLSLFPINTDKPSFHRPDYFGQLYFS